MENLRSEIVETNSYEGQIPGTSGLRKPVKIFKKLNYTENFVQSIFNYLGDSLEKSTIILGGDGRYYCHEAAEIIIRMAAANKVRLFCCYFLLCVGLIFSVLLISRLLPNGLALTSCHSVREAYDFFKIIHSFTSLKKKFAFIIIRSTYERGLFTRARH